MPYVTIAFIFAVLVMQPAFAEEKPANVSSQINQEMLVKEFEKSCAGFMEKFKTCEPFSCEVTLDATGGVYKGTNAIQGKDKAGCRFEMVTVTSDLPPLTYRCVYSEKTHAVVFRVMEAQLKDSSYVPEVADRKLLEEAAEKECKLEGEEAFVRSLDAKREEMIRKAKEKMSQPQEKPKEGESDTTH